MTAGCFSFLQVEPVHLVPNKAQMGNELKKNQGKREDDEGSFRLHGPKEGENNAEVERRFDIVIIVYERWSLAVGSA